MDHKRPIDDRTKSTARALRQDMTFPERLLWSRLRGGRLDGFRFRRQHPIAPFVVDYFCHAANLVIELDGLSHVGEGVSDANRQRQIERLGFRVLRVTNDQVLADLDAVLELIRAKCRGAQT